MVGHHPSGTIVYTMLRILLKAHLVDFVNRAEPNFQAGLTGFTRYVRSKRARGGDNCEEASRDAQ